MADQEKLDFEPDFLARAVALVLRDKDLLLRVRNDFRAEDIPNPLYGLIVASAYQVSSTGASPTREAVRDASIKLSGLILKGGEKLLLPTVLDKIDELFKKELEDADYIRARLFTFVRKNAVAKVLDLDVEDLFKKGEYQEIINRLTFAVRPIDGENDDIGSDYFQTVEQRIDDALNPQTYKVVPTGFKVLDGILEGGLYAGQLGVVVGGPSKGKSLSLVNLGYAALAKGKKVIHYSLEMSRKNTERRYDMRICGFTKQDLLDKPNETKSLVRDFYNKNRGELIVRVYPTKQASPETIRQHLKKVRDRVNWTPDLIIIDYADIMRSAEKKISDERLIQQDVYESLRALSIEYDVPVWTASQGNRQSMSKAIIGLVDLAEAFGKAFISDVVISLNKNCFFVAKNRDGPAGDMVGVKADPHKMTLTECKLEDEESLEEDVTTEELLKRVKSMMSQKKYNSY